MTTTNHHRSDHPWSKIEVGEGYLRKLKNHGKCERLMSRYGGRWPEEVCSARVRGADKSKILLELPERSR